MNVHLNESIYDLAEYLNISHVHNDTLTATTSFPASSDSSMESFSIDQEKMFDEFIKKAFITAYNRSFDTNKMHKLTIILSVLSIIGSASNFLVLIVMACRDDCMDLETYNIKRENKRRDRRKSTFVVYSMRRPKPIYLLIQYLSLVDFLTCSLAMPGTRHIFLSMRENIYF